MQKIDFGEEKNSLLLLLAVFVLVGLDMNYVVKWQWRSFLEQTKSASQKRQVITTLKQEQNNLAGYRAQAKKLEEEIKAFDSQVTDEAMSSILMEIVSDAARDNGVKVSQIKPAQLYLDPKAKPADGKSERFKEIGIDVTLSSGFHQLGNFISSLESQEKFFKLIKLQVISDPKNYFFHDIKIILKSVVLKTKS